MEFNEIINRKNKLLIENYFDLQVSAELKYGPNTIVLVEIGSFYEVYQYDNIGKAKEVSKILNILLTKKNKKLKETNLKNPWLCGIPSVTIDKHLDKLISEEKWNILLVKQKGTPPNIERYVEKIVSPGTIIDSKNEDYNFIASIYLGKNKNNIVYGSLSMIDLSIGRTFVYEGYGTSEDPEIVIDEIEKIVRTHNIKEIVFTCEEDFEEKYVNIINSQQIPSLIKSIKDYKLYLDISYQNDLFEEVFNAKGFFSAIEALDLERMPLATNSLSILISFIIEHNKSIASNLQKPEIINSQKFMYLGNNPILQLDIHSKDKVSVSKIINNGATAIGRRFILEQLLNPLIDMEEINKRYINSSYFIENDYKEIRDSLSDIYDIERIWRKVELDKLAPFELYNYYVSLKEVLKIIDSVELDIVKEINIDSLKSLISEIENTFIVESLSEFNLQNITRSFIKKGVNKQLDSKVTMLYTYYSDMEKELENLNKEENIASLNYTETEGYYFEITKKKFSDYKDHIDLTLGEYEVKRLKNSIKIFTEELKRISTEIIVIEKAVISLTKDIFNEFNINVLKKEFSSLNEDLVKLISHIDFYINNAILFKSIGYSIPEILDIKENFYEAEGLRHPIVEKYETDTEFISNDIILGSKQYSSLNTDILYNKENDFLNGFLLYGINSAGKTVLTKSIGISIMLAQAGFFVPAKKLRMSIKDSLFTRISGSDNLQKGLSTFAIEMLELKNIFNRSTENSIILGDEISHGTETISGLSIVASTVMELVEKKSLFVLSTHLHQLSEINDIKNLKEVTNVHLSIKYDEDTDLLIYDRKLKPGSGSSVYGLEFAKSLKLSKSFIERAYRYRKEIGFDLDKRELLIDRKTSRYNSKLNISLCEICGEKAEETHHIKEQHKVKNGVIDGVKKNHKGNLVPICKNCHNKIHEGEIFIEGYRKTQNGKKLIFTMKD